LDALLGTDFAVAEKDRCIVVWTACWNTAGTLSMAAPEVADLFQAEFEVLLYDLTSTTLRCNEENPKAKYGHSRANGRTFAGGDCAGDHTMVSRWLRSDGRQYQ